MNSAGNWAKQVRVGWTGLGWVLTFIRDESKAGLVPVAASSAGAGAGAGAGALAGWAGAGTGAGA